jgi:tetratricopeptide (TPR) repeat protein
MYPRNTPWTVRIEDRERFTRVAPESPEAWYLYGDALFHYGLVSDVPNALEQARRAFEQSVRLDSLFGAPLTHLADLAFHRGDSAGVRQWAARFLAQDSTATQAQTAHWYLAASTRDDRRIRTELARLDSSDRGVAGFIMVTSPFDSVTVAYHADLVRLALKAANAPQLRSNTFGLLYATSINHGRPAEARRWLDSALATDPARGLGLKRNALVEALFTDGDTTGIEGTLVEAGSGSPEDRSLYALVELVRGRTDSAERLIESLRSDPALRDTVGDSHFRFAALLEAGVAAAKKDPALARKLELADSLWRGRIAGDGLASMTLPRWHEQAGRPDRALIALRRRQTILGDPSPDGFSARLRLEGRLAAKVGERDAAIRAYRTFLWWYSDPEPSRIPVRDSVRAELAALMKP